MKLGVGISRISVRTVLWNVGQHNIGGCKLETECKPKELMLCNELNVEEPNYKIEHFQDVSWNEQVEGS